MKVASFALYFMAVQKLARSLSLKKILFRFFSPLSLFYIISFLNGMTDPPMGVLAEIKEEIKWENHSEPIFSQSSFYIRPYSNNERSILREWRVETRAPD